MESRTHSHTSIHSVKFHSLSPREKERGNELLSRTIDLRASEGIEALGVLHRARSNVHHNLIHARTVAYTRPMLPMPDPCAYLFISRIREHDRWRRVYYCRLSRLFRLAFCRDLSTNDNPRYRKRRKSIYLAPGTLDESQKMTRPFYLLRLHEIDRHAREEKRKEREAVVSKGTYGGKESRDTVKAATSHRG